MGSETMVREEEKATPDYLAQLLKDKRQMQPFGSVFLHLERILDEEIDRVRQQLFQATKNPLPLELPEESGPSVVLSEKLYVPAAEYPEFNFVGRILGPRGMTAKQLEQSTGCRIMVRGRGSTRDKKREESYKSKSSWEHLNDALHVLITAEDTEVRARLRLDRAVQEVKKLLVPAPEGEDDLKKLQLMELAIINGTYRDSKHQISPPHLTMPPPSVSVLPGGPALILPSPHIIRTSGPAGPPIILAPRLPFFTPGSPILSPPVLPSATVPPPLLSPPPEASGIIFHVDLTQGGLSTPVFDYTSAPPLMSNGLQPVSTFHNHYSYVNQDINNNQPKMLDRNMVAAGTVNYVH